MRLSIFKYVALFVSLAFFLALGFALDTDVFRYTFNRNAFVKSEQGRIVRVLKDYNLIYSDLYAADGTPAMLNTFPASKMLRHEVYTDIGFLRANQRIIVYDAAESTLVDVTVSSPTRAEAIMYEDWNFLHQQRYSRKPLGLIKGFGQGFRYKLAKQKNRWIVISWDPVNMKAPTKEEEFKF